MSYGIEAIRGARQSTEAFDRLTTLAMALVIVALLPAAFWTAFLGIASASLGYAIGTHGLATFFTAIAGFLTLVFGALARKGL